MKHSTQIGLALVLATTSLAWSNMTYAKQHGELPPGLQKKVDSGKPLPPGWQKKYHRGDILARHIYERGKVVVPLDSQGLVTINVDGSLFRLQQKTREIIEILSR